MPSFSKGPNYRVPFGKNQYLGSTRGLDGFESYTCAASTVPTQTIDGYSDQKVLQSGTLMAKITSGADSGKIGPFDAGASDGRQTQANIVGFCDTFLPWQLMERDVEVAVLYDGTVVQAWCFELASGAFVALTNTTLAKVKANCPGILYRQASTEL